MESVTRFWSHEAQNIRCVREADFERVAAERDALQLLLNNRDDLDDQLTSLEQRRYAEQQAREVAERRVVELTGLLKSISICYRATLSLYTLDKIEAALNPTAEAVSHE